MLSAGGYSGVPMSTSICIARTVNGTWVVAGIGVVVVVITAASIDASG